MLSPYCKETDLLVGRNKQGDLQMNKQILTCAVLITGLAVNPLALAGHPDER